VFLPVDHHRNYLEGDFLPPRALTSDARTSAFGVKDDFAEDHLGLASKY
jgi:hypothetical protein